MPISSMSSLGLAVNRLTDIMQKSRALGQFRIETQL